MAEEAGSRNSERRGGVTRREVVIGGGSAAVGGGAAAAIVLAADDDDDKGGGEDRLTCGFIARVEQVGRSVTSFGYLTRVRGFRTSLLYTRPPGRNSIDPRSSDPSAARLTLFSECTIEALSTIGAAITSVAPGGVQMYFQSAGGARFDDPRSFARGQQIASLRGTFQNNLAVDAPNRAGVALTADLTQEGAARLRLDGSPRRFGRKGLPWSMRATGRGERLEREAPRAQFLISGSIEVVGALK